MKRKSPFWIVICAIIFISACKPTEENNQLTIVTTTGIIGDCVSKIVPENCVVISLMGAGVDPHLYKATQGDLTKLSNADIIVYNGLHLEGKMAQVLEKLSKNKPAFAVGDFIDHDALKRVDNTSDLVDPHIWFNPELWMQGMEGVANELGKIDGLDSAIVNFKRYKQEVLELEGALANDLNANLPNDKRILITSHDAFEYFGDAFNFKVRGLQGISTAAEYGAKDVKDLIDFVVDNNIKSVFVETSVSDKNLKAVIEGAAARDYELKIGGTLYSDALGPADSKAGTYTGMLEANVQTIINGLK